MARYEEYTLRSFFWSAVLAVTAGSLLASLIRWPPGFNQPVRPGAASPRPSMIVDPIVSGIRQASGAGFPITHRALANLEQLSTSLEAQAARQPGFAASPRSRRKILPFLRYGPAYFWRTLISHNVYYVKSVQRSDQWLSVFFDPVVLQKIVQVVDW